MKTIKNKRPNFVANLKWTHGLLYIIQSCNGFDFNDDSSLGAVATKVNQLSRAKKYEEYEIKTQPYVFIKASNDTYGMDIITATSGEEILNLNKKSVIK